MANVRALTGQSGGLKQVQDTDALYVGNAIERDPAATAASVNLLTNTAVTTIFIGRVGELAHFYGDLQIDGSFTYTNLTLTGDLTVQGNTTLGNAPGDSLTINPGFIWLTNDTSHTILPKANVGAGVGLTIKGGESTGSNGGDLALYAGESVGTDGGYVRIEGGTGTPGGVVIIGATARTNSVDIGRTGKLTRVYGDFQVDGTFTISSLTLTGDLTVRGNTTLGNGPGDTLTINSATIELTNDTDHTIQPATLAGLGRAVTIRGGDSSTSGGGDLCLYAGNSTGVFGASVYIDAGNGAFGGKVMAGTQSSSDSVEIGRTTRPTTIKGNFLTEGDTTLGNASTDALVITTQTVQLVKEIDHNIFVDPTTTVDTSGGWLALMSGTGGVANASGGGIGGQLALQSGMGGDGDLGGDWPAGQGGPVTLSAGGAGANNGGGGADGGSVSVSGGNASGLAAGGQVSIYGGQADSGGGGTAGSVVIDSGTSWGGTDGLVSIGTSNADLVILSRIGKLAWVYGGLQVDESLTVHRVTSKINYLVATTDLYVGITDTTAPRTVILPQATTTTSGHIIIVKDESGGASGNNITIQPDGTVPDTIDGQANLTIAKDYGCKWLMSDGISNWEIIGVVAEGGAVADPLCTLFAGVASTNDVTATLIGGGNFDPARFVFTNLYFEASGFINNSLATGTVQLVRVSDSTVIATLQWTGAGDTTQNTKSVTFTAPGAAEEYLVEHVIDNASYVQTTLNARIAAI